jgi:hypothetical protein
MRRDLFALAAVVVAGCSGEQQSAPPPVVNVTPAYGYPPAYPTARPEPPSSMSGTIGGRPFAARAALMVHTNKKARVCSSATTGTGGCSTDKDGFDILVSSIRIYERDVGCEKLGDRFHRHEVEPIGGEHYIEVELQGRWPLYPGSVWRVDDRGPPSVTDDHVQTVTFRSGGSGTGSLAYGEVRFVDANDRGGTIAIKVSAANPQGALPGSLSGTMPFTICPER